jgi:endonuclease G, mitochondrial
MRLIPTFLAIFLTASPSAAQEANRNVRFGVPVPTRPTAETREHILLARPQYVLSYNGRKLIPNWVAWQLRESDIGHAPRMPFEPDLDLPRGVARVTSHDYEGSGFDRGHMCPAKDRSASHADSKAVFNMTNIIPQAPACNQKGWERLEDYCRRLAKEGKVLQIVCGPAGVGGEGVKGHAKEIGHGKRQITVPAKVWKVVLVLPREDAEPRKNTRVIAVILPNDESVDFHWAKYRVTTRAVEKLAGYRFFTNVPEEVAEALRDHLDEVHVPVSQPRRGKN